jgi:plastocyanin
MDNNSERRVVMNKKYFSYIYFVSFVLIFLIGGCKTATDPYSNNSTANTKGTPNTVIISGFQFSPTSLTVAKGTTITWQNNDATLHTATSDNASWNTGDIAQGATKSILFNTSGTFAYHCAHHTSMKATIIVN